MEGLEFSSAVLGSGVHLIAEKCHSCGSKGQISGRAIDSGKEKLVEGYIGREVRVLSSKFECQVCDLRLPGLDEILAAKLPSEKVSFDELDPFDTLGIDPKDHVDMEEIAREYHYDEMYEYQDE